MLKQWNRQQNMSKFWPTIWCKQCLHPLDQFRVQFYLRFFQLQKRFCIIEIQHRRENKRKLALTKGSILQIIPGLLPWTYMYLSTLLRTKHIEKKEPFKFHEIHVHDCITRLGFWTVHQNKDLVSLTDFHYIEVLFHTFNCNFGCSGEYRSLCQGLHDIENRGSK